MDEVNWIYGPIYLSSYEGAKNFQGLVIFVHHDIEYYSQGLHIPILKKRPNDSTDRRGAEVNVDNLELIHALLDKAVAYSQTTLVHCRGGIERSPLVVATWLTQVLEGGASLDTAYNYIKLQRPVVEDRRYWLDQEGLIKYRG